MIRSFTFNNCLPISIKMEHIGNLRKDMVQIHLIHTSSIALCKDYDSSMKGTISTSEALFLLCLWVPHIHWSTVIFQPTFMSQVKWITYLKCLVYSLENTQRSREWEKISILGSMKSSCNAEDPNNLHLRPVKNTQRSLSKHSHKSYYAW